MTEYRLYENHGYTSESLVSAHKTYDEAKRALDRHTATLDEFERDEDPWDGGIRLSIVRATGDHEEAL